MKSATRVLLSAAVAIVGLSWWTSADAQDARRPKKLIEVGWDMPDSQHLPGILDEVEKQPFDGLVVQAIGRKDDGSAIPLGWAFLNQKWSRQWFQSSVDQLKGCKFRRFTDNFLIFNANPGDVDWFDDAGWKNIVEHWRIAAWVARQSGFKGICFDPEPYASPHAQFTYSAQAGHDKHSFAEYYEQARRRGREIMQAVVEEYPDITIHSFFLCSVVSQTTGHTDPRRALSTQGYGLLPAMLDGWLDAAPPTVTLVDGCESSYLYNSRTAFLEMGNLIRGDCQNLISPANRGKYRAQVQTGFGIYLDVYANPKGSSMWYIDGQGMPRVERLRMNVRDALSVADEYVWIYGEQFRWWPTLSGRTQPKSWSEALPGCAQSLRFARDPIDFARTELARLRAAGKLVNLARNGNFQSDEATMLDGQKAAYHEGATPAGWHAWQTDNSKGTFTWDRQSGAPGGPPGAGRIAGVTDGCLIQDYHAKPGEYYAISALQRVAGKGQGAIRVRWQTADGKWIHETEDVLIYPSPTAKPASGEWVRLFGVARVPDGVGRMVVLLGASGQSAASDVIWYDDVEVHKLP